MNTSNHHKKKDLHSKNAVKNYVLGIFIMIIFLFGQSLLAQVGVGNTDPKATLDITVADPNNPTSTDGILVPRVNTLTFTGLNADQDGMLVYLTTDVTISTVLYTKGFYYWDQSSTTWVSIFGAKRINDLIDGKSDPNAFSLYLGVNAGQNDDGTNNINIGIGRSSLNSIIGNISNVAIGNTALEDYVGLAVPGNNVSIGHNTMKNMTTGALNTAVGQGAMENINFNTNSNVAIGTYALRNLGSGTENTALGYSAGNSSNGSDNVFLGFSSGRNISGSGNVFIGYNSASTLASGSNLLYIENSNEINTPLVYGEFDNNILRINGEFQIGNPTGNGYYFPTTDGTAGQVLITDGSGQLNFTSVTTAEDIDDLTDGISDTYSVFLGTNSGNNDDGNNNENTGVGRSALTQNTSGQFNTAVGSYALNNNTTGFGNVALGHSSLYSNTANYNIAIGTTSLYSNTSGSSNIAIGGSALQNNTTGGSNIAVGAFTARYTNGDNNVVIGDYALEQNSVGSNNIVIGVSSGYDSYDASGSVFIGNNAAYYETNGNRLYIENTDGDADNALIYGEFDNDILRTNGELQIGNPTATGYALPTNQGTASQVLTSNGDGTTSWSTLGGSTKSIVSATMSSNQSVVTNTKVEFDTIVFDTNSEFNTTDNRFVATNGGYYRINASLYTNASFSPIISIYVNGSIVKEVIQNRDNATLETISITGILSLNATDYVEIFIYLPSGSGTINGNNWWSSFEIEQID